MGNLTEWLWLAALFLVVTGAAVAVLRWVERRRQRLAERLAPASAPDDGDSRHDLVLGELTPAFAGQIPISVQDREHLARELRDAGYYSSTALTEYSAIRALLLLAPLVLAGLFAIVAERRWIPYVLVAGVVLAVLGFSLPRFYLHLRARRRRRDIERGLPVAVDLLALSLSGGQTVLGALDRLARELRFSHPVLSEEFEIVYHQAGLTSLRHGLQQLAARVRVPEVRNLVTMLTQTERLGTDLATALLEFAQTFRTTLRQRADATANRLSLMMLFPTVLGLWIPAAALLIGPILFEFKARRDESKRMFTTRTEAQQATQRRMEDRGRASETPASEAAPAGQGSGLE